MGASDTYDFLVIGSGSAGLTFALHACRHGAVAVVTKQSLQESNSAYAQGGIASVWSAEDSFAEHVADTVAAGAGLCHRDVVEMVVREGPERVRELILLGAKFSTSAGSENELDLGREGGHSRRRVLHAADVTGREIIRALAEAVRAEESISILEHQIAVDLLIAGRGEEVPTCWGAYVLDKASGLVRTIRARITVLATGGSGKVYLYTSNPDVATGDGVAMAYRAGAVIGNMEFFQFHPTCLYHPQAKSFLVSEALRGEGAVLRLPDGTPFMRKYHPAADLAPRDVVARAIDNEMKTKGFDCVYLDITHRSESFLRERFPNIAERCLSFGVDLTRQWIPVVPAAHYQCGGVVTNENGATNIRRLYACGEVAMTGLHGANRLASNSLLEAIVFARRAALDAARLLAGDRTQPPVLPPWNPGSAVNSDELVVVNQNWDEVRRLMWNYVGIVRTDRRLERAKKRIALLREEIQAYYWDFLITSDLVELRNIATVAELIIVCASRRRESRGLHFNLDVTQTDDERWCRDTLVKRLGGRDACL